MCFNRFLKILLLFFIIQLLSIRKFHKFNCVQKKKKVRILQFTSILQSYHEWNFRIKSCKSLIHHVLIYKNARARKTTCDEVFVTINWFNYLCRKAFLRLKNIFQDTFLMRSQFKKLSGIECSMANWSTSRMFSCQYFQNFQNN